MKLSSSSEKRIEQFVDWLIRSSYAEHARYSNIEENYHDFDRSNRCEVAAENGSDGSTHAEVIGDFRDAFTDFMDERMRVRWQHSFDHFTDAVEAHFDALELWHENNGTLHKEIG